MLGTAFGGPDTLRGNTGPFWIGSGRATLVHDYIAVILSQ